MNDFKENGKSQAFPRAGDEYNNGLTKLEYFSLMILSGMNAHSTQNEETMAANAIKKAKALLKELEYQAE